MSEPRYVPQEERAAWLIEKGARAWQAIQRLAMSDEEPLDSVVLLGQELWLPHHETEGRKFSVALRLTVRYPVDRRAQARERVSACLAELEDRLSDERGRLVIQAEEA